MMRTLTSFGFLTVISVAGLFGGCTESEGGGAAGSANGAGGAGQGGQGGGAAQGGDGARGGQAGASGGSGMGGGSAGGAAGVAGMGGTGGTDGDGLVSDVSVSVHPEVNTVLVVTWQQLEPTDTTWLEFTFEAGDVMTSRPKPGAVGEHRDVVLGVPGETPVTIRIVNQQAGNERRTRDYQGTTDAVPAGFPKVEVRAYAATLASPDRWLFGAVEDSEGGSESVTKYYRFLFWTYIMDRKGRIVWYYADPSTNATSSFQRLARDGEYIWIEKMAFKGDGIGKTVLRMTLDHSYFDEIELEVSDCIDVTADGGLLYDYPEGAVKERAKDGTTRDIWTCKEELGRAFNCYTNTVNWNAQGNTILLSFPFERTVVEIDRTSGMLIGQYGAAEGSYAFSPDTWEFGFQHFPNITSRGTLLLSSHMPGTGETPVAGQHGFLEFEIDRPNKQLVEKWYYNEGLEWAGYKGMAILLPNGNVLANYGTGGVIREITPDKQTAFDVKFDVLEGDDFYNKMVGNNFLIDDLYSMNGGPK